VLPKKVRLNWAVKVRAEQLYLIQLTWYHSSVVEFVRLSTSYKARVRWVWYCVKNSCRCWTRLWRIWCWIFSTTCSSFKNLFPIA
jgi:hypothetical protein